MPAFNTKYNVGDYLYYLSDFLDVDSPSEVSDLFENATDNICKGAIKKIEITNKGVVYVIGDHYYREDELYETLKDAFIKIMTVLKTELENKLANVTCVLVNAQNDFEKCCKDYEIEF